jgi:hypothetical protein
MNDLKIRCLIASPGFTAGTVYEVTEHDKSKHKIVVRVYNDNASPRTIEVASKKHKKLTPKFRLLLVPEVV